MYVTEGLTPLEVPPGMLGFRRSWPTASTAPRRRPYPHVIPDEVRGGREAANHLLAFGHRDIAMVAGDPPEASAAPRRVAGYREAYSGRQLPVREDRILRPDGTLTTDSTAP